MKEILGLLEETRDSWICFLLELLIGLHRSIDHFDNGNKVPILNSRPNCSTVTSSVVVTTVYYLVLRSSKK
jgi:hypothetical protein